MAIIISHHGYNNFVYNAHKCRFALYTSKYGREVKEERHQHSAWHVNIASPPTFCGEPQNIFLVARRNELQIFFSAECEGEEQGCWALTRGEGPVVLSLFWKLWYPKGTAKFCEKTNSLSTKSGTKEHISLSESEMEIWSNCIVNQGWKSTSVELSFGGWVDCGGLHFSASDSNLPFCSLWKRKRQQKVLGWCLT